MSEQIEVTPRLIEAVLADPDAWEYIAHHAIDVRRQAQAHTHIWHLLGRVIKLAGDMSAALHIASADAEIDARPDEPAPRRRPRKQPNGPTRYLPELRGLLDAGVTPEIAARRLNRSASTISRAARREGDLELARLYDRIHQRTRRNRAERGAA